MTRLDAEQRRLFLPSTVPAAGTPALSGPDGRTRALVLEIASPAAWTDLARVWQGLQADLDLPAAAIAVNGEGGCQLWLSLAQPEPSDSALAFLDGLRLRYLPDVRPERVRLQPPVAVLPPAEVAPGRWSAFVTPDLAALFADEPWLDQPPGMDAQAEVLSRVLPASPEQFGRACARLQGAVTSSAQPRTESRGADAAHSLQPAEFLLAVMRDPAVELHLRIEAAKALLPSTPGRSH